MFCKNCGKELMEEAKFCPYCGKAVKSGGNVGMTRHTYEKQADMPLPGKNGERMGTVQQVSDGQVPAGKTSPTLTLKRVIRMLALLCIAFVFCPSFLVSCSGQEMNVSVMTAVKGVSVYGQKAVDPHPLMIVCLLIPILVVVLTIGKRFADRKAAVAIFLFMSADLVIWMMFRSAARKIADDNLCGFKTTVWFVMNMACILLIIILSALAVLRKLKMDEGLLSDTFRKSAKDALSDVSDKAARAAGDVSRFAGNITARRETAINDMTDKDEDEAKETP